VDVHKSNFVKLGPGNSGATPHKLLGFGLSMGSELRSLTEIIGGSQSAMNLYQSFRDPTAHSIWSPGSTRS